MASRRRKEPDVLALIRFIADHESLSVTADEFSEMSEERIRAVLRHHVDAATPQPPPKKRELAAARAAERMTALHKVLVYTDGAARGNPGPAGAGWVICTEEGELIARGNAFLGRRTNNEAEYDAVIRGLAAAGDLGAKEVGLRSDSELLVRQINGTYRVKEPRLQDLHRAAREVLQRFRRFEIKHVPREENGQADEQANLAIDDTPRATA